MRLRLPLATGALALLLALVGCGDEPADIPAVATPSSVAPAEAPSEPELPPLPPDPPALAEPIPAFVLGGTADPALRVETLPDGYTLALLGEDGAEIATVRAEGARGNVSATARREGPDVIVSVRADSGDFVDRIDGSGTLLGRARLPERLTRTPLTAPEDAQATRPGWGARFAGHDGRPDLVGREPPRRGMDTPIALHREGSDAALFAFHDPEGCIALTVVETDEALLAAQHCPRRRGVLVLSLAPEGPLESPRWLARPTPNTFESVGSSRVALRVDGSWVRVWVDETGARYVATVDLATGRIIALLAESTADTRTTIGS